MTSDTIRTDYVYCGAFTAKRFGALAALIAQNTALVLVTKFSFSRGVLTPYLVSTVVACSESLKFVVSCALLTHTHGKGAAISATGFALQRCAPRVAFGAVRHSE